MLSGTRKEVNGHWKFHAIQTRKACLWNQEGQEEPFFICEWQLRREPGVKGFFFRLSWSRPKPLGID
jgi:hypothetical protein